MSQSSKLVQQYLYFDARRHIIIPDENNLLPREKTQSTAADDGKPLKSKL